MALFDVSYYDSDTGKNISKLITSDHIKYVNKSSKVLFYNYKGIWPFRRKFFIAAFSCWETIERTTEKDAFVERI